MIPPNYQPVGTQTLQRHCFCPIRQIVLLPQLGNQQTKNPPVCVRYAPLLISDSSQIRLSSVTGGKNARAVSGSTTAGPLSGIFLERHSHNCHQCNSRINFSWASGVAAGYE